LRSRTLLARGTGGDLRSRQPIEQGLIRFSAAFGRSTRWSLVEPSPTQPR
jgi:hypothetical protein